jgi:hypothetical protein
MFNQTEKEIIISEFIQDGLSRADVNILDDQHFVKFALKMGYKDQLIFSEDPKTNLSRLHYLYFDTTSKLSRLTSIQQLLIEYRKIKSILSYLAWIDSRNNRQCIFVQSMLNFIALEKKPFEFPISIKNGTNIVDTTMSIQQIKTKIIDNLFIGETLLSNPPKKAIDLIFDFFIISQATLESKIEVINKIKEMYASASSENKIEEWIKKEKRYGCIDWLEQQPAMINADFEWLTSQKTPRDIAYFIIYLDLLFALKPDTAHLYTGRIKKAWSQKKTRDKNKAKSQYNFIMSPDIKGLLNEICEAAHISRNDLVEAAIRNEYKRFKSAIR